VSIRQLPTVSVPAQLPPMLAPTPVMPVRTLTPGCSIVAASGAQTPQAFAGSPPQAAVAAGPLLASPLQQSERSPPQQCGPSVLGTPEAVAETGLNYTPPAQPVLSGSKEVFRKCLEELREENRMLRQETSRSEEQQMAHLSFAATASTRVISSKRVQVVGPMDSQVGAELGTVPRRPGRSVSPMPQRPPSPARSVVVAVERVASHQLP